MNKMPISGRGAKRSVGEREVEGLPPGCAVRAVAGSISSQWTWQEKGGGYGWKPGGDQLKSWRLTIMCWRPFVPGGQHDWGAGSVRP